MTNRLREAALWAGAALGLLAVAAGIAVAIGGFGFLIFRSGSMEPEIPTGGIALSRTVDAADIEVGDVVSVVAASGSRITHRVVGVTLRGDQAVLVLKGDANSTEDAELYVVSSAERVLVSAPFGGYVVAHALTPPGLIALGSLSLMLIVLSGGRREDEEEETDELDEAPSAPNTHRHRADVSRVKTVATGAFALLVIGGAGASALSTSGTLAAFTDRATTQTGSFAAATIAPPVTPVAAPATNGVTLTWSPATSVGGTTATRYEVIRYTTLNATTGTVACTAIAPTLSCTDTAPISGISYYGLRARIGTNWIKDSAGRVTYTSDTTGPTITFTVPADGYSGTAANTRSIVAQCGTNIACGTAADNATGVVKVEYTFRRTIGLFGTTYCWNGTTWLQQNAACTFANASGTTTAWRVPGIANDAYPSNLGGGFLGYTYVLTIRATDGAGNVTTSAINFQTN